MKLLKHLFYATSLAILLFSWWLGASLNGASLLLMSIDRFTGIEVRAESLAGSLIAGLEIEGLKVDGPEASLVIENLQLRWRMFDLLQGEIYLPFFIAREIKVELKTSSEAADETAIISWFPPVNVEKFVVNGLQINGQDKKTILNLQTVRLNLMESSGKLALQDMYIENRDFSSYAHGTFNYRRPYRIRALTRTVVKQVNGQQLTVDARLEGDENNLDASLRFHDKFEGNARITIRDILRQPDWSARLLIPQLNLRDIDDFLPNVVNDLELSLQGSSTSFSGAGKVFSEFEAAAIQPGLRNENLQLSRHIESDITFNAQIDKNKTLFHLSKAHLQTEEGEFELSGRYEYPSRQLELDASWEELVVQVAEQLEPVVSKGSLSVKGLTDRYELVLKADTEAARQLPSLSISVTGQGDQESLSVKNAQIRLLQGTLTANTDIRWQDDYIMELDWRGDNFNPSQHWRDWPGRIETSGGLRIRFTDDRLSWQIQNWVVAGNLRSLPLSAAIQVDSLASTQVKIDSKLEIAGTFVELTGSYGDKLDLSWQLESDRLSSLHPSFQGQLTGKGEIHGSRDKPEMLAQLDADQLVSPWINSEKLAVNLQFDFAGDALLNAEINGRNIRYEDLELDYIDFILKGRNSAHQFELNGGVGALTVAMSGAGGASNGSWTGDISSLALDDEVYALWENPQSIALSYKNAILKVSSFCLKQVESVFCADGHYNKSDENWNIVAQLSGMPLSAWNSKLPETLELDGHFGLQVDMLGKAALPVSGTARMLVPQGALKLRGNAEFEESFLLDNTEFHLELEQGFLNATGRVPDPGYGFKPFNSQLTVSGLARDGSTASSPMLKGEVKTGIDDISLISALLPQLLDLKGRAELDILLSGSMAEPVYDGVVSLSDAGFSSSDLGIEVRDIQVEGTKQAQGPYQINGELSSGNGKLRLKASATEFHEGGPEFALTLEGEDFELVNLPEFWALVNPELSGSVSLARQLYKGRLLIPEATINLDELAFVSAVSDDEVIDKNEDEKQSKRVSRRFDVSVELGQSVRISGKGITGRLTGALAISTAMNGELVGDGEIAISEAQFSAYGQDLDIEEGRLIFSKSALDNPVLRVVAVRDLEDFKVGVKVDGYSTAPQISLFATKSLPQEQILSYIIFGRSISSLSSREGSDLLGAATSMGLNNSGFITDKIAATLGLDQVSLSGSDSQSASVIIGKYINPKLYLSYGLGIFDKISTARLKYDLSRRLSLEAERGAETGVDIFYRINK